MSTDVGLPRDWLPMIEWTTQLYGKQKEFLHSFVGNWETLFCGGNGSGKTHVLYLALTLASHGLLPEQEKFADPPFRIKVLLPDFEHGLETVCYEKLFTSEYINGREIGPMMPKSSVKRMWKVDDRSLQLEIFGKKTVWNFMTSEQKKKLHSGTTFDILACDEEAAHGAYDESKRGLRNGKGGGRILHSLTPPYLEGQGPSWTKFELIDPWEEGDPDINVIRACMMDNPAISEEFVERFSKGKTEEQLRVQLYGEYPSWGAMVHPDFKDELWDPKQCTGNVLPETWPVPYRDESVRFEMAIDWHQSKPAAAIWSCEDKEGNVIVYDEFDPQNVRERTISELAEIIFQMEGFPHRKLKVTRYGDPKMKDKSNAMIRGFSAWQEFRNCKIFLSEGYNRQPEVGISIVNDFIRGNTKDHPRLFVTENCRNTRKALRNHYWKTAPSGLAVPDPKWSDYPICLRYILQNKGRSAKMRGVVNKGRHWGVTSYDGVPGYAKYKGAPVVRDRRTWRNVAGRLWR